MRFLKANKGQCKVTTPWYGRICCRIYENGKMHIINRLYGRFVYGIAVLRVFLLSQQRFVRHFGGYMVDRNVFAILYGE